MQSLHNARYAKNRMCITFDSFCMHIALVRVSGQLSMWSFFDHIFKRRHAKVIHSYEAAAIGKLITFEPD